VLPLLALHLIASGQANGQLATMLDKAANDLEQQLQNTITAMLALIEPLMMLIMGGIVLVIVMAVMVPILDMNQLMM
jgi:general secretion pathway protein F